MTRGTLITDGDFLIGDYPSGVFLDGFFPKGVFPNGDFPSGDFLSGITDGGKTVTRGTQNPKPDSTSTCNFDHDFSHAPSNDTTHFQDAYVVSTSNFDPKLDTFYSSSKRWNQHRRWEDRNWIKKLQR